MAESARLESECTFTGTAGSNPVLSVGIPSRAAGAGGYAHEAVGESLRSSEAQSGGAFCTTRIQIA